jgi:hypothetical protein
MNEFDKDLQIDVHQLDVEAAMQGELFFKWAERSAEATKARDRAKLALDVLEAELDSTIRQSPEEYGLSKVTEGAIQSAIKQIEEWQKAQKDYIEARSESALTDHAVSAMEQRKRMIEVLVTLHGQEYFAGPSVPRDLVSAFEQAREEREKDVTAKQKTRTHRRKDTKGD